MNRGKSLFKLLMGNLSVFRVNIILLYTFDGLQSNDNVFGLQVEQCIRFQFKDTVDVTILADE